MRISDWSSDVCSSDLREVGTRVAFDQRPQSRRFPHLDLVAPLIEMPGHFQPTCGLETDNQTPIVPIFGRLLWMEDRKSAVSGKSVSVRVDLVGGCLMKKKQT